MFRIHILSCKERSHIASIKMAGTGGAKDIDSQDGVLESLSKLLSDPKELHNCVMSKIDEDIIASVAWDLTSTIMGYLTENLVTENLELYGRIMTQIAKVSSPKELYLGVLEHFDPGTNSRYVELLIPSLSVLLKKLRLEEELVTCATVLETTFATLSYYLESLNVPKYDDYDPKSKKKEVFEAVKILRFAEKFMAIVKPTTEKILKNENKISDVVKFKQNAFQFLCSFLVTIAEIDLDAEPVSENVDSAIHVHIVCHDVMKMTVMLHSLQNLWSCKSWVAYGSIDMASEEGKVELAKQIQRGRACFLYLLLCRGILFDRFAKVASPQWILANTVFAINTFLSCSNQAVVWKGLEILSYIIGRTPHTFLMYKEIVYLVKMYFDDISATQDPKNRVYSIFEHLVNVATSLPSKTIRSTAIQLLVSFLNSYSWDDKYVLLLELLKRNQHIGVSGVLIGFLKDKLSEILQDSPPKNSDSFCDKKKLQTLGKLIFLLPQGTETDLLEDSDRLMPALNLLRFLLIRDKMNKTGVFDFINDIKTKLLTPLRNALDLSRTHFENELSKYASKKHHKQTADPEFTVHGMPLPNISFEDQKKTLQAALHTFDMIEIVTVRVNELIETKAG